MCLMFVYFVFLYVGYGYQQGWDFFFYGVLKCWSVNIKYVLGNTDYFKVIFFLSKNTKKKLL